MDWWRISFDTFYASMFGLWSYWMLDQYLTIQVEEFFSFND